MKSVSRRDEIASYVSQKGTVRIEDLAEHFAVSRMTIHRHVDHLARQGVLRKLHGAVSAQPSGLYESLFRYRETVATPEKAALARAAVRHIGAGEVIMLDDSSTAISVAPLLVDIGPLTVITNSVPAATFLADHENVALISPGGTLNRVYNAYTGHVCESGVARLRADVLICSVSAISSGKAFVQSDETVRVKRAMMASAARRILLVDHTKVGRIALHVLADLIDFDLVVVSESTCPDIRDGLRDAGVRLEVVEVRR